MIIQMPKCIARSGLVRGTISSSLIPVLRRIPLRVFGVALLAASGASTLAHRAIYEAAKLGPPQILEAVLTATSFSLASVGMVLVAYGRKLLRSGKASDVMKPASSVEIARWLDEPIEPHGAAYDTRCGVSLMRSASRSRSSTRHVPD